MRRAVVAAGAAALLTLATGCASREGLRPFTTDACSLFPDRAPIGKADWCACCVAHDLAYWKGGTEDERLAADRQFRECVQRATGNRALAESMFGGVRTGGSPYLPTWFRWAYGWPYERNYEPLTAQERAHAAQLESEFRASAAPDACVKSAPPDAPAGTPAPPGRPR